MVLVQMRIFCKTELPEEEMNIRKSHKFKRYLVRNVICVVILLHNHLFSFLYKDDDMKKPQDTLIIAVMMRTSSGNNRKFWRPKPP